MLRKNWAAYQTNCICLLTNYDCFFPPVIVGDLCVMAQNQLLGGFVVLPPTTSHEKYADTIFAIGRYADLWIYYQQVVTIDQRYTSNADLILVLIQVTSCLINNDR